MRLRTEDDVGLNHQGHENINHEEVLILISISVCHADFRIQFHAVLVKI